MDARVNDTGDISGHHDAVDIRFLVHEVLRRKLFLTIFILVGLLVAANNVYSFRPKHQSVIVVSPGQEEQANPQGGRLGDLAYELGLQPAEDEPLIFERLKVVFGSVELASILQQKYGLLQRIYASSWDSQTGSWQQPEGMVFRIREKLYGIFRFNRWSEPDLETLARHIRGRLKLSEETDNPFVEIRVEDKDAEFSLWLLTTVLAEADELLKQRDRAANVERKAYLRDRLEHTSVTEMRRLLLGMLMAEESNSMLLQGTRTYAFQIIEPAFASSRMTEPSLGRLVVLPILVFLGLGIVYIAVSAIIRHEGQ